MASELVLSMWSLDGFEISPLRSLTLSSVEMTEARTVTYSRDHHCHLDADGEFGAKRSGEISILES